MLNSVAAGRRLALRAIAYQLIAVLLAALAALVKRTGAAWGVVAGGVTVAVAGYVSAQVALGGGVQSAGSALGRLLAGMLLKWCVVIVALAVSVAVLHLPPLPVLLGVLVSTLALVAVNSIQR